MEGGGGRVVLLREARCSLSAVLILAFLCGAGNGTLSGLGAVQWTNSGLLHVEFVPLRWATTKKTPDHNKKFENFDPKSAKNLKFLSQKC